MSKKEIVSDKQAIAMMILFIIGSSSIVVTGLEAKYDLWLAIILSVLMALPMVLVSSRLHTIFPGKDLFDMLEICFGKIIGKGVMILFTWFVFEIAAETLRNFSQFVVEVGVPGTPIIVPMICLSILCGFIIKSGIEVMGRWAEVFLFIPIIFIIVVSMLLIPEMHINNIKPVLYKGMKPVFMGAFKAFAFPFGQTVLFTMFFSDFKTRKSPYKVYISGLFIGGIILLITSLTNIFVLSVDTASKLYFPSYEAISRLKISEFFQRVEIISATTFILGQFLKISILLFCACRGFTKIFGFEDYRFLVTPIAILMVILCDSLHISVMDFYEWVDEVLPYYCLPFQVFFPVILLITAEIKKRKFGNT